MSRHITGQITLNVSADIDENADSDAALSDIQELVWEHLPTDGFDLSDKDRLEYVGFVDSWRDVVHLSSPPPIIYRPEKHEGHGAIIGYLEYFGYQGGYSKKNLDVYAIDRSHCRADHPDALDVSWEDAPQTTDLDQAIDYVRYSIIP